VGVDNRWKANVAGAKRLMKVLDFCNSDPLRTSLANDIKELDIVQKNLEN